MIEVSVSMVCLVFAIDKAISVAVRVCLISSQIFSFFKSKPIEDPDKPVLGFAAKPAQ